MKTVGIIAEYNPFHNGHLYQLKKAKENEKLSFIEVKCSIGAREDLGRPTTTSLENKQNFMEYLKILA